MNSLAVCLLVCLTLSLVSGSGRPSPNADKVKSLLRGNPGLRYTDDVIADALLDAPQLISRHNYSCEVHHVTTADGYILGIHRIPHGRDANNQPGSRIPVFLLHGLQSSSADYLTMGPGTAIGYLLAEEGYDVWLGNARGNYYSRNHTTLDPDDRNNQEFWRFSWEEIGNYDLPATIDYILATTGQPKLHYIGHSQGGTSFIVLNSLRPEYNEKFISYQGLAPATFFNNNQFTPMLIAASQEFLLDTLAWEYGLAEVLGPFWYNLLTWFAVTFCPDSSLLQSVCLNFPFLGDYILGSINATMVPAVLGHVPAGSSIRQLTHFAQSIRRGTFSRYDYGLAGNLINYRQFFPPPFDVSKVTAPVYIHYTLNDDLVHYEDIYLLANSLGRTPVLHRLSRDSFSHTDFIWGFDAREILNPVIVQYMKEAESAR